MNIVIFNPYGIGNTLLLLPFLSNLKKSYPTARILMVVTQRVVIDLLDGQGLIGEFVLYNNSLSPRKSKNGGWLSRIKYAWEMLRLILVIRKKKADILFILESPSVKSALFVWLAKAKECIGHASGTALDCVLSHAVPIAPDAHEVEWRLDLLRALGHHVAYERPKLRLPVEVCARWATKHAATCNRRPIVGLHPGCSNTLREKRWPAERFALLIHVLMKEMELSPILFGGPDDKDVAQLIMNDLDDPIPSYVNRLDIMNTAGAIANCDLFISNDSGLMHLAAAVGTPVIALFGNTSVSKNAPQVDGAIVIVGKEADNSNAVSAITVEEVLVAVKEKLCRQPDDPVERRQAEKDINESLVYEIA
ncbi:MAG: hypothetical protein COW19_02520 [Zetaproteobacteria bacterium CG12_big_fil_rev_8_21_14_0_65_55_1124]|nr:MAG: hypothetical protein AUJ58_08505 [Zetaproteobacteria bacterium CG1_02_55_237]PIS19699.1 MAG: hypothetical protein COT53_04025 [Zetaproteobacteria bacterium CG08_land_8_20_14_0_20_55_17]PIW43466.1 MAG: hypothetical protein COW19_02520 [Zetaproteobacteria bacterium CG12_big_fil_rev_8_21_14_0_65_55_1124]PIY54097.1 MAG: hypothetical protein COZ01_01300 [Zetaproteobacteria bacterium CG_4_10_14_0_8_um_filter_55_43]PIZ39090.1 MAG: hypothetical protein COY36_03780 [Zetaproteobacteria bacterium 